MANFNKVILIGNLTKDPELRYTPNGTAVLNLRLASNHRFKDRTGEVKQETCFITVVVWDKQAETCNQYLQKGSSVLVEGRLQSRNFQDNNGQNRSVIEVRADRVVFLNNQAQKQTASTNLTKSETSADNTELEVSNENGVDDIAWSKEIDEQLS